MAKINWGRIGEVIGKSIAGGVQGFGQGVQFAEQLKTNELQRQLTKLQLEEMKKQTKSYKDLAKIVSGKVNSTLEALDKFEKSDKYQDYIINYPGIGAMIDKWRSTLESYKKLDLKDLDMGTLQTVYNEVANIGKEMYNFNIDLFKTQAKNAKGLSVADMNNVITGFRSLIYQNLKNLGYGDDYAMKIADKYSVAAYTLGYGAQDYNSFYKSAYNAFKSYLDALKGKVIPARGSAALQRETLNNFANIISATGTNFKMISDPATGKITFNFDLDDFYERLQKMKPEKFAEWYKNLADVTSTAPLLSVQFKNIYNMVNKIKEEKALEIKTPELRTKLDKSTATISQYIGSQIEMPQNINNQSQNQQQSKNDSYLLNIDPNEIKKYLSPNKSQTNNTTKSNYNISDVDKLLNNLNFYP